MNLGYARVSTMKQVLVRQVAALAAVRIAPENISVGEQWNRNDTRSLLSLSTGKGRRAKGLSLAEMPAGTGITRATLYRHLPPQPAEPVTATGDLEPRP